MENGSLFLGDLIGTFVDFPKLYNYYYIMKIGIVVFMGGISIMLKGFALLHSILLV